MENIYPLKKMEKNSQIIMSSKSPLFKAIVKGYLPDIDYILSTLKVHPNSIIDSFNNQNTFFYSALIKDDNQALKVFKYLNVFFIMYFDFK